MLIKLFIPLFTLFIINLAIANDELTPHIEKYITPKVKCPTVEVANEEVKSDEPSMYTQCLAEICGSLPTIHSSEEGLTLKVSSQSQKTYNQLVEPFLERHMTKMEEMQKESLPQLTPQEKNHLQDSIYISHAIETVSRKTFGIFRETIKELQNSQLSREDQYNKLSELVQTRTKELLTREYNSKFADTYSAYTIRANQLSSETGDMAEKIIANTDEHEALYHSYKEKIQNFPNQFIEMKMTLLAQLHSYTQITRKNPNELKGLVDLTALISSYEHVVAFTQSPNYNQMRRELVSSIKTAMASELPSDQALLFQKAIEKTENTQFRNCQKDMGFQMNQLVSNKDSKKSKESIRTAVEAFAKKMLESDLYSEETLNNLYNFLTGISIKTPPSREEYVQQIESGLNEAMSSMQQQSHLLAAGTSLLGQSGFQCGILPSHNVSNFYRHGAGISDSYIYLSNQALHNFDEVGMGILHHELGHAVSFFVQHMNSSKESKGTQANRLSCLGRGHLKGNFFQRLFKSSVPYFQEEDFADAIAATVYPDRPNLGCALLIKGQPRTKDRNMTTHNHEEEEVFEEYQHSSSVFRVISSHVYQDKKVPKSCEEPLKSENFDLGYNGSCLGWEYAEEKEDNW